MSDLETLKAQHPVIAEAESALGTTYDSPWDVAIRALASALQQHEATIAERDARIATLELKLKYARDEDTMLDDFCDYIDQRDKARVRVAEAEKVIQHHEATIADLENLRDYCKVCPNCGAESDKGPYAPMDEEGCCLCCGADCSVEGLAEWAKEQERDLSSEQQAHAATREELRKAEETIQQQARELEEAGSLIKLCIKAIDDEHGVCMGLMGLAQSEAKKYFSARHSARAQQQSEAKKEEE